MRSRVAFWGFASGMACAGLVLAAQHARAGAYCDRFVDREHLVDYPLDAAVQAGNSRSASVPAFSPCPHPSTESEFRESRRSFPSACRFGTDTHDGGVRHFVLHGIRRFEYDSSIMTRLPRPAGQLPLVSDQLEALDSMYGGRTVGMVQGLLHPKDESGNSRFTVEIKDDGVQSMTYYLNADCRPYRVESFHAMGGRRENLRVLSKDDCKAGSGRSNGWISSACERFRSVLVDAPSSSFRNVASRQGRSDQAQF